MTSFRSKPKPPATVSASAGAAGISVTWPTPPLAGKPVGGFVLYRNGVEIASLSAAVRAYTDSGAQTYISTSYAVETVSVTGARSGQRVSNAAVFVPASAIQWEPGHYITTTGGGSAITTSTITTIANYVNARSFLEGVVIRPYWTQIETAQGVYDWSLFDHALSQAAAEKGVWLQLQLTRFNTSSTDLSLVVPSYMLNSTYLGGGHIEDKLDGTYDLDPKVWVQPVMDRLLALIAAFGARYASDTRVRGYVIAELQFDLAQGEDDFDSQTWIDLITEQYIPGTRAAMPTKNVIVYMNYINGNVTNKFAIVRDACIAYDCMIGGPDTIPCEGGSTGLKVARGVEVTNGLPAHDCRGEIGIMCSLQQPDLGGRYCTTWTGQQYVEWIYGTQQANVVFWTYIPADSKFTGAMTYIQNNLAASFVPDYPSGFPT